MGGGVKSDFKKMVASVFSRIQVRTTRIPEKKGMNARFPRISEDEAWARDPKPPNRDPNTKH